MGSGDRSVYKRKKKEGRTVSAAVDERHELDMVMRKACCSRLCVGNQEGFTGIGTQKQP